MKASLFCAVIVLELSSSSIHGQTPASMDTGDIAGMRTSLARAAQSNPNNPAALSSYAEFLDRYGDPQARDAYAKLLTALRNSGDTSRASAVAHRVALLNLLAGDRAAASRNATMAAPSAAAAAWPTTT